MRCNSAQKCKDFDRAYNINIDEIYTLGLTLYEKCRREATDNGYCICHKNGIYNIDKTIFEKGGCIATIYHECFKEYNERQKDINQDMKRKTEKELDNLQKKKRKIIRKKPKLSQKSITETVIEHIVTKHIIEPIIENIEDITVDLGENKHYGLMSVKKTTIIKKTIKKRKLITKNEINYSKAAIVN